MNSCDNGSSVQASGLDPSSSRHFLHFTDVTMHGLWGEFRRCISIVWVCQNAEILWNLDEDSLKETEDVATVRKVNDFLYLQIENREREFCTWQKM